MNNQVVTCALPRALLALAITLAALLAPLTARAVPLPQFGAPSSFSVGNYPHSLVVADFNGDAKLDIAVAGNAVRLLLGLGDGTFAVTTNVYSSYRYYLAAGDFNNDGNLDLVALGSSSGTVLLGDGSGNFPVVTNSNPLSAYNPAGLAIGDFNGNGNLDVAMSDSMYHTARVVFGRGDGSFGLDAKIIHTNALGDIRAGDISGNGRLDVVAYALSGLSISNRVCVLTNKGDSTFAAAQYYDLAPGYSQALELADLNCDGSLDLALLNPSTGLATIRLNDGAGAFGPPTDYLVGFPPSNGAVGDFNGDRNIDLILRGGTAAAFLLGHGDGSFTVGTPMSLPSVSWGNPTVAVGDFNGDGTPDIAYLDSSGGAVVVRLNQTPPLLRLTPMSGYNQISWLTTFGAGYTLEYTTNSPMPGGWQPFPYPPVLIGSQKAVTDWQDQEHKFYRLRKP